MNKARAAVAAVALAAAAVVTAAPAQAATVVHLCEAWGAYCVGAPTLTAGSAVQETLTGRNLYVVSTGTSGQFYIEFASNTHLCVAAPQLDPATVQTCGSTGTVWIQSGDSSCPNGDTCWKFANRYESGRGFGTLYLAGADTGADMYVSGAGFHSFTLA